MRVPEGHVKVTVLYNVGMTDDEPPRPVWAGRLETAVETGELVYYQAGDPLEVVAELTLQDGPDQVVAESAFRQMNRVDGNEYISRKNLAVRSMCTGDVAVIHRDVGTALAAEAVGWSLVDIDEVRPFLLADAR